MKIIVSVLSKLLAGIAGIFSLTFFTRKASEAASEAAPEGAHSTGERDREQGAATTSSLPLPRHGEPMRPGWNRPAPEVVPRPTYWPMVFGLGITFFMWGLISNLFVLGLGIFLLMVGLVGWILDLVGEFGG